MLKRCYFCKGRIVEQGVGVDFRWGDELEVIEDVSAEVCQQCGEKYLRHGVYKAMERLAKTRAKPIKHSPEPLKSGSPQDCVGKFNYASYYITVDLDIKVGHDYM